MKTHLRGRGYYRRERRPTLWQALELDPRTRVALPANVLQELTVQERPDTRQSPHPQGKLCKALVPFPRCPRQLGPVCLDFDHVLIEIQVLVVPPPRRRGLKRKVNSQHSRAGVPSDLADG